MILQSIGSITESTVQPIIGAEIGAEILPPSEIADLALWYEVQTANVIKDGSNNVTQHTDLSGNARHATQATVANTYSFVDSVINGNPITRSSGSSGRYTFDGTFFQNSDATVISVQKRTAGGQNIIFGADSQNNVVRWEYANDTSIRFTTRSGQGPTAASAAPATPYAGGSEPFRIMAVTFSNTSGIKFYQESYTYSKKCQ